MNSPFFRDLILEIDLWTISESVVGEALEEYSVPIQVLQKQSLGVMETYGGDGLNVSFGEACTSTSVGPVVEPWSGCTNPRRQNKGQG